MVDRVAGLVGKTATCRACAGSLKFLKGYGYYPLGRRPPDYVLRDPDHPYVRNDPDDAWDIKNDYISNRWVLMDGSHGVTCPQTLGIHAPKEYCWELKADGEVCGKPTDRDNWLDDLYACGVHMKIAAQRQAGIKFRAKAKAEQEARKEVEAWQLAEAQRAFTWLEAHGWRSLLLVADIDSKGEPRLQDRPGAFWRARHRYSFELLELQSYLEERGYDGPGTSADSKQADMGNHEAASVFD